MADERRLSAWESFVAGAAAWLGGLLLRLWFSTCRVEMLSKEEEQRFLVGNQPAIGITWHQHAIFFLWRFGFTGAAVMISRSKDGEYLARFASRMGCVPVRGSSSRGGVAALKEMARALDSGVVNHAATVADGPRGPRRKAKKGMIVLAMNTGLPLFPIAWSADRCWVLKSTWDQTMLPKPFAKIKMMAGKELRFPPEMSGEQLEQARRDLEDELNRITDELDRLCGRDMPPQGE